MKPIILSTSLIGNETDVKRQADGTWILTKIGPLGERGSAIALKDEEVKDLAEWHSRMTKKHITP